MEQEVVEKEGGSTAIDTAKKGSWVGGIFSPVLNFLSSKEGDGDTGEEEDSFPHDEVEENARKEEERITRDVDGDVSMVEPSSSEEYVSAVECSKRGILRFDSCSRTTNVMLTKCIYSRYTADGQCFNTHIFTFTRTGRWIDRS
jgi:hypothetical protein